jgi:protein-glutamine gamma-glutamyltransferase
VNLPVRLRWCVAGVLLLGLSTYVASERDALLALGAYPLLALGLWLTRPASGGVRGPVLPGLVVPLLIIGVSIVAMMHARAVSFDVTLVAYFAIALMIIKLGDRRSERDEAQLLALSTFLTVAAVLTSPELLVGLQAMVFFPVLVYSVMIYQLYRGQGEAPAPTVGAGPRASPLPIARTACVGTGSCLVVAIIIFIITPRGLGENFMGGWVGPNTGATVGFADSVNLGRAGVISESPEVVLDLRVEMRGKAIGGPGQRVYLRGAVLDEYDPQAFSWRSGTTRYGPPKDYGPNPLMEKLWQPVKSNAPLQLKITLRAMPRNLAHLFTTWRPMSVTPNRHTTMQIDDGPRVFRASANGSGTFSYEVLVDPTPGREHGLERQDFGVDFPSDPIRRRAREILRAAGIEPDPMVRAWDDDHAAALGIADSFLGGFEYTLDQPAITPGLDPIEEFLFTTKRGHCEYFASAMVALCRSVGIQSRVVTGYVANEFEQDNESYVVRRDDAHAWVEIQAGGHDRWITLDPTPPDDLARVQQRSTDLVGVFRRLLDRLEFAWNRSIVSFDNEDRKSLIPYEASGRGGGRWLNWLIGSAREERGRRGRILPAVLSGVVVAAVAAGMIFLGLRGAASLNRRRTRIRALLGTAPPKASLRESAALYASLLALWERRRLAKPEWRPPLAHVQAITGRGSPVSASGEALERASRAIISLLYATRFGGQEPEGSRFHEARSLLARAEEALRADGR